MTDADKLQKLIELAQTNGWDMKREELYPGVTTAYMREIMSAAIIFDHAFIKALCRAIHDKGEFCCGIDTHRDDVLKELAISTNRIDYLWETFKNEG